MSKCRSCGASVIWFVSEKGKPVIVDPEPIEEGNIIIKHGPGMDDEVAHYETKEEKEARLKAKIPAARTAYRSHFVTCPDAKKWRKGGRTKNPTS
jgi:hypothetical protein